MQDRAYCVIHLARLVPGSHCASAGLPSCAQTDNRVLRNIPRCAPAQGRPAPHRNRQTMLVRPDTSRARSQVWRPSAARQVLRN